MLYFLTGNKNKISEAQSILGDSFEAYEVDLPEIQELDPHKIIEAKLYEARRHKLGSFFVEDTSLYFDKMNGLPGPLIKWFMESIGNSGLYEITKSWGSGATAKTVIGYMDENDRVSFVEGAIKGTIVKPRGETNFGWDPIFLPKGHDKTFAEMDGAEKNEVSMRKLALQELKKLLQI